MEMLLGILIGIISILSWLTVKTTTDKLDRKINKLEQKLFELEVHINTELQMMESDNKIDSKLGDRIKIMEEELKIEKKYNGLNFQKAFKDIIKLREHLTYLQNK
jgi:hypothetical protein